MKKRICGNNVHGYNKTTEPVAIIKKLKLIAHSHVTNAITTIIKLVTKKMLPHARILTTNFIFQIRESGKHVHGSKIVLNNDVFMMKSKQIVHSPVTNVARMNNLISQLTLVRT